MAAYDFIDQNIVASALIQPHDDDSFYNPVGQSHTGFASDGQFYQNGVLQVGHALASWYTEVFGPFRGSTLAFPTYGLILLSPVAMAIYDESTPVSRAQQLPLWMMFLLADGNALANNFNGSIQGYTPSALNYADGVISVTYIPDAGNQPSNSSTPPSAQSHMVVSIDFVKDAVYLDVAL
jgi:hypothetical protein